MKKENVTAMIYCNNFLTFLDPSFTSSIFLFFGFLYSYTLYKKIVLTLAWKILIIKIEI